MKKEIEKQFDKKFTDYPGGVYLGDKPTRKEDILSFIEKAIQQERDKIIREIEKMRTAPPENAKTEVKNTFQTINNTISGIVMRIKTLK